MKPIIIDMKDMSDIIEVYETKPNPFLTFFIYGVLVIVLAAFTWMWYSKIEIVVKCNGIFRCEDDAVDVSCSVNGVVTECNITEGQYVDVGDVLFTINSDMLEENIANYEDLLNDTEQRIEILNAYEDYLNGEINDLDELSQNKYYSEFVGRKELLELSKKNEDTNVETQKSQYENESDTIKQQISQYEEQISEFQKTEECIINRNNTFTSDKSYYESIVSSYISNYELTASQYDTQIDKLQGQLDDIKAELEELDFENDIEMINSLNNQIEELEGNIEQLSAEKESTLNNLELQQITSIEQQITTINNNLITAKSNQTLVDAQLDTLNKDYNTDEISELKELQSVASELISYENKKTEYESILKQYDLESDYVKVLANNSGYIYLNQELNVGSYVTQGSTICRILSGNSDEVYAEIYVQNKDIAKLHEGQKVKFEIAAYPSSEYGYFNGVIDSIPKDIKVDGINGSAYYLVKVRCDNTTLTNKKGETGNIINGMACQAKIVVDEERILKYLLKKIDLTD